MSLCLFDSADFKSLIDKSVISRFMSISSSYWRTLWYFGDVWNREAAAGGCGSPDGPLPGAEPSELSMLNPVSCLPLVELPWHHSGPSRACLRMLMRKLRLATPPLERMLLRFYFSNSDAASRVPLLASLVTWSSWDARRYAS